MINPTVPKKPTVAEFITTCLAKSTKTQRQIADECGLENQNNITMFKTGASKVPVNRAGDLAKALEIDPIYFLRMVLAQYLPDAWAVVEATMPDKVITAHELKLVLLYREATGDTNQEPVSLTRTSDTMFTLVSSDAAV